MRSLTKAPILNMYDPLRARSLSPRREQQGFGMRHCCGQLELRGEARRRREIRARLRCGTKRAVEIVEERLAATSRKPFARQAHEVTEFFYTNVFQKGERFSIAHRLEWHLFEDLLPAPRKP